MSNVKANTEKPKRDKYTWLKYHRRLEEMSSSRQDGGKYTDIFLQKRFFLTPSSRR